MKTCSLRHQILRSSHFVAMMCCLAMGLLVATFTHAQGPPQYLVTTMENDQGESFRPVDINDAGWAVLGKYSNPHLYVYVPGTRGLMYDLNDLDGATWVDHTGQPTAPWIADTATGINESNQIVGRAFAPGEPVRVYVLDNPLGPNPVFKLLPNPATVSDVYGVAINDNGVAVGTADGQIVVCVPQNPEQSVYAAYAIPAGVDLNGGLNEPQEINNLGDIVTSSGYIVSPGPDLGYEQGEGGVQVHYYEGYQFFGINDSGQIAGTRPRISGRNGHPGGTTRFQYFPATSLSDAELFADPFIGGSGPFCDVNESGDVAFGVSVPNVYLQDLVDPGPYSLDQRLVFATPEDEARWMADNRAQVNGINDQGQIIVRGYDFHYFLDPRPGIAVNDVEINEGDSGTTTGSFTVTLSGLTGEDVTVPYQIADGSATTGEDYTATLSDVLVFDFALGELKKTVDFTIIGDTDQEPDETFTIVLGEAVGGATVSKGTGTATINNDDGGGSAIYSSNDTPLNIRDRKNTFSTISIGDDVVIAGMTINLDITHGRPSDLTATLTGPDGTSVDLPNVPGDNDVSVDFGNKSSLGDWTLNVRDNERGETGTLNSWSITIDY